MKLYMVRIPVQLSKTQFVLMDICAGVSNSNPTVLFCLMPAISIMEHDTLVYLWGGGSGERCVKDASFSVSSNG